MAPINFISTGTMDTSSIKHRCIMISDELRKRGYETEVFVSGLFLLNSPNLINSVMNWENINRNKPEVLIVHRTSNLIDYLMVKKLKKRTKVIYDIDDAIFHTRFPGILSFSHINPIIKEADYIFAGSHYLFDYASKINSNVSLVPTAVDTELFSPINTKRYDSNRITIGWMGNGDDYQLRYLNILKEPLRILSKNYDIKFRIVSALSNKVKQAFANEPYDVDFGLDRWVKIESMPEIISDFDIGVMPLTDNIYEKGKCAMKALEYMSLEKPVVASAVGENNYVIKNDYNGFLASDTEDWVKFLEKLILNNKLRRDMGKNGRRFVEENYSLKVITKRISKIIEEL